jgi:hypothetical protein
MKAFVFSCCLFALVPLQARALSLSTDLLPAIAMPLAVDAVTDVPGVQTDRVAQLVTYMDEANVPPADFVDVFRYVPVALVMHADSQPDFVEWTHQQIVNGITGPELVTVMKRQLRTYDNTIPVVAPTRTRRIDYAFANDYVPAEVRDHTDRLLFEPLSLIEMPVAVANVYDINGLPIDRVIDLVTQLNAANVPPVQFVEVMRYAPVAVVQPDFVPWVQTQVVSGVTGYSLVNAIDHQLIAYDITPEIDLGSPVYYGTPSYYPQVANYVAPVDPTFVATAHAVTTTPQVQRLLAAQPGTVVVNPSQVRRELKHVNREIAAPPVATVPPMMSHGHGRGHVMAVPSAAVSAMTPPARGHQNHVRVAAPRVVTPQEHGRGHGHGNEHGAPPIVMTPPAAPPQVAAPPAGGPPGQQKNHGNGNEHGNGKGKH